MQEEKYENLAKEIKRLFTKKLGQFKLEDFNKVVEAIRAESFGGKPDYYKAYEKLSPELRDQIDFMMGL